MNVDTVDWKLIGTCNLRCLHCYGPPKTQKSLPHQELEQLIERFKALKVRRVVLTGGEPLLVPSIGEVMRLLHEAGIAIALSTNTSFFSKYQNEIERYVYSLNIPLDGSTSEIHQRSRADARTFFSCLEVLQFYQNNPQRRPPLIRVGTVYSKATAGDFLAMANLLEPFSKIITTWKIYELIDYEFQPELRREIIHKPTDFEQEMILLLQQASFGGKIMIAPASLRDKAYFMINPSGELVLPTDENGVTREIVIGNLLSDPLEKLVEEWGKQIDPENYRENHEQHYGK